MLCVVEIRLLKRLCVDEAALIIWAVKHNDEIVIRDMESLTSSGLPRDVGLFQAVH